MKTTIAIDPGASGGIAVATSDGVQTFNMPREHADIITLLREHKTADAVAWIEEVPKFCGKKLPASSIFVMAQNHGVIVGACLALGYELRRVRPQDWQARIGSSKKAHGTGWKRFLKARAQEIYPALDVTLATADALLILDHARRMQ